MSPIGRDFRQGSEHERTVGQPRMGNIDLIKPADKAIGGENVEIERPRPPPLSARPSESSFYAPQPPEQRIWRETTRRCLHHRVMIVWLVSAWGPSGTKPDAGTRLHDEPVGLQGGQRRRQQVRPREPVPREVRAERDKGVHFV